MYVTTRIKNMFILKKELLPLLTTLLPDNPIIVEAGAFDGTDSKKLALHWPKGTIHAFEPVPEIFTLLEKNTHDLPNIKRYPYALSNQNGSSLFYVSENPKRPGKPCQAGTLLKPQERLSWSPIFYPTTTTVSTITLKQWMNITNINYIDLLWLDLQGNEFAVLHDSEDILPSIKLIYTEVSFINAYEGQPKYSEVLTWLEKRGFEIVAQDFNDTISWFFGNILLRRK